MQSCIWTACWLLAFFKMHTGPRIRERLLPETRDTHRCIHSGFHGNRFLLDGKWISKVLSLPLCSQRSYPCSWWLPSASVCSHNCVDTCMYVWRWHNWSTYVPWPTEVLIFCTHRVHPSPINHVCEHLISTLLALFSFSWLSTRFIMAFWDCGCG